MQLVLRGLHLVQQRAQTCERTRVPSLEHWDKNAVGVHVFDNGFSLSVVYKTGFGKELDANGYRVIVLKC
jgi:hypothetical protein